MKNVLYFTVIFSGLVMMSGCSTTPKAGTVYSKESADLLKSSHEAAYELIKKSRGKINSSQPIIAASFSSINNLDKSSSFGRIASQQFASAFTSSGYTVTELLLRDNIYIKQRQGEFLLSRSLKNISDEHNAQAVIVGTYAEGRNKLFVTAKVVDTGNNTVISSYDYVLPIDPDLKALLR